MLRGNKKESDSWRHNAQLSTCNLQPALTQSLTRPTPFPKLRPWLRSGVRGPIARITFMNVLICDPISPKGIDYFKQQPGLNVTVLEKRLSEAELLPIVGQTEAMVVRSETKVTRKVIEAAPKLRVV